MKLIEISLETRIQPGLDQVSVDLAGEAALLNIKSGIYFGLDPVGARVWQLIQTPVRVSEVLNALTEEYEVDKERCTADLLALLREMTKHDLIKLADETH